MNRTSKNDEQSELIQDPFARGVISGDLRAISYRVALATPRIAAWAQGKKISVKAGLYVSRAKSVAAYALALGISTQQALEVVQQLTASDPSRADYRKFVDSVSLLLTAVAEELVGITEGEA